MNNSTSLNCSKQQLALMSRLYDVFNDFKNEVAITPEYIQDTLVQFAYVSLKKYSEITQIPFATCRAMVAEGHIIIRPKKRAKDMIEVNMIAMLMDAYNQQPKNYLTEGKKRALKTSTEKVTLVDAHGSGNSIDAIATWIEKD